MNELSRYRLASEEISRDEESDALRLEAAQDFRVFDVEFSEFIELQIESARRRRTRSLVPFVSPKERSLARKYVEIFSAIAGESISHLEMDRGFVTAVAMSARNFLEKGGALMHMFPITHVSFFCDDEEAFPMNDLLHCAALGSLDSIDFSNCELSETDMQALCRSRYFASCRWLDLSFNEMSFCTFRAIAASPHLKQLIFIGRRESPLEAGYFPGQRLGPPEHEHPWNAPIPEWQPLGDDGRALEREFGYIPWLHPQDNACDKFDARYFVEKGILPKKPPGSPVEE